MKLIKFSFFRAKAMSLLNYSNLRWPKFHLQINLPICFCILHPPVIDEEDGVAQFGIEEDTVVEASCGYPMRASVRKYYRTQYIHSRYGTHKISLYTQSQ